MIGYRHIFRLAATAVLTSATAIAAFAQEPQPAGTFNNWAAYSYKSSKGKVCYIIAKPASSKPAGVNRDPVHMLVTHRPGEKVHNEVNTIIGYPFKKGSTATVMIDGNAYKLFTSGDGAWAESASADRQLVAAMKAGSKMVVRGTSWRGTVTTDTYSLEGVTAAMKKIDGLCR